MKKLALTFFAGLTVALIAGCTTTNSSADASRTRTAYAVQSDTHSRNQDQGFYWPVSPTLEP